LKRIKGSSLSVGVSDLVLGDILVFDGGDVLEGPVFLVDGEQFIDFLNGVVVEECAASVLIEHIVRH
jgi:hypothetical protein